MAVLPVVLLGLMLVIGQGIAVPVGQVDEDTPVYRLNGHFIPTEYKINIKIPDNFQEKANRQFTGDVTIKVKKASTKADENELQLHMDQFSFTEKLKISVDNIPIVDKTKYTYNDITQILKIPNIPGNTIDLKIEYVGQIYDDMYGLYLSEYQDQDGNPKHIATTQFQPTYARRAFPCWDEPEYKAKFTISLEIPDGYKAISNQPEKSNSAIPGPPKRTKIEFNETPEMSTYLIAFVVNSDFGSKKVEGTGETTSMSVYAPNKLINDATYASKISWKLLDRQGKMFGDVDEKLHYFNLGMKKLDTVAIPDFAAGAMENWGLMTFRETALLVDSENPKKKEEQRVAAVLAHEFAHSWFGDYVTTHWWSDTWLNEGFATYFESHCVAATEGFETFAMEKQFILNEIQTIMETDGNGGAAVLSSKEKDVNTLADIQAKFGTITYSKGGAIVRMMEKISGGKFMDNLRNYLNKANTGNKLGTTDALFTEFDKVDKVNFTDIMTEWITQPGYPVIEATLNDKKVVIKQKPFLYSEPTEKDAESKTWNVPIIISEPIDINPTNKANPSKNNPAIKIFKKDAEDMTVLENLEEGKAIIINPETVGFYRVKYDSALLERIKGVLENNPSAVADVTRAQLINDFMNLARANQMEYADALKMLEFLKKEENYFPWQSAFNAFSFLRKRLVGDSLRNVFTRRISTLAEKFFNINKNFALNDTEKENAINVYTKVLALEWACEIEEPTCVDAAVAEFESLKPNNNGDTLANKKFDVNFNSIIYCAGLRHSSENTDWVMMWNKFKEATNAAEKVVILTALGCTRDENLLNDYLDMSLDNTKIRKQDAMSVFSAVLQGNPEGVKIAQVWLQKDGNLAKIKASYGSMGALSKMILQLSDRLTDENQVASFKSFIDENKEQLGDAAGVAENAMATALANIEWASSVKPKLSTYLIGSGSSLVATSFLGLILFSFVARLL